MAKNVNAQSVEPNVADLVNGWLKTYKLDYKLEQESLNTEIDQALNDYFSKNGGKGGNRPDAKLLLHANDGKYYPILIEYKGYKDKLVKLDTGGNVANKTSKNQPDFTNINSYAVNGAVHYKAKELPKQPTDDYVLPCLTSSFQNQGLNYYAPKAGATVLRNVISIPSNSDVYRAYYQTREFTVLSDAYAIRWKSKEIELSPNQYLFMVMCINKVTDLPIYSYKNKLGGWNVVKEKFIRLPAKNGKIDFEFMDTFISGIKKLAIKDVVLYSDQKIAASKAVVAHKSDE